jgi:hypothetical protein
MIICDFSGISIATIFSQPKASLNENLIRHMILNSLRMYNTKYRDEYGKMILACDSNSWRKDVFKEYKASRKTSREKSDLDWSEIFNIINNVKSEIEEFMPYPVLQVRGAEADDIIATLVECTQEFGCNEKVMIISSDKDFAQLQKYKNVEQFSPSLKKKIVEKNPQRVLFEHIIRGDDSDGVPNVMSNDDVFVSGSRQSPIRSTSIDKWWSESQTKQPHEFLSEDVYRNYLRNKNMIDLSCIPSHISEAIKDEYKSKQTKSNSKVLNYLISKRCNQLVGSAEEFFIKAV